MCSLQGNVQVYHDGVWGGICDDEWGEAEAEIACKELGFSRGAVGPTHSSQFGYSPRIIWMDNGPVANVNSSVSQSVIMRRYNFPRWLNQSTCHLSKKSLLLI